MLPKLPDVQVKNDIIVCRGGMDTMTPPLMVNSGMVRSALNFQAEVNGGYQRIPGYERFDGHPSPTDLSERYVSLTVRDAISMEEGSEITGEESGARGLLVAFEEDRYIVVMLDDNSVYKEGEPLYSGRFPVGRFVTLSMLDERLKCHCRALVANHWRRKISAVPGSGPVRGVWEYRGTIYAFRDNESASKCRMYRATPSGWKYVETPDLAPGGSYEFVNNNFSGAEERFCMYGASGTHRAFQFDGDEFVFIDTGMEKDTPTHITAHLNHLFLSFGSSVQHSPIGDPTGEWSVVLGAGEIALSDVVTGFIPGIGNQETSSLLIATRNQTFILYGSSSADWTLVTLSRDTGAIPGTLQKVGDILMLDDRGVSALSTSASFGNFIGSSLSVNIHDWIVARKGKVATSCISREKNQYRIFFSGKEALYITYLGRKSVQFMPVAFAHDVRCVCSTELPDGSEATFFGSGDGKVYQLDKGSSFDGEPIPFHLIFTFNHSQSPRVLKRYRKLVFDLTGDNYCEFKATTKLGYDDTKISQPGFSDMGNKINIPRWDHFWWDNFIWDGRYVSPTEMSIAGSAENMALHISGESADFLPFVLMSVIASYTPRRRLR
jgi:hypothetical protein